jgi:predicted ATPase
LIALTEALAISETNEIRIYQVEVHPLGGELPLRQPRLNIADAQGCFQRTIEVAKRQSAKSLELRATTSLAQLLESRERCDQAHAMLADISGWFTEDFDTADLKDAKALLDDLAT